MFGLCDCNNFYVSCERLFNPALEGRAVVVMSGNDGCVVARSNEAKALGIKMGQPMFQIADLVKRQGVVAISGNLQLYGDISSRVMTTLADLLPSIEVYSIDEAFIDLSGFDIDGLKSLGEEVSRGVRRSVGVPVSLGIAPTKTLAKVAAKLCKSYPRLKGCCLMYRDEDIAKVLNSYPVGDVWGIGRRSVEMLKRYNITTAEQFRAAPKEWVQSQMGVTGLRTWSELHSQSCIELDGSESGRQSIMVSRSFRSELRDFDELRRAIATFATRAAEKLRGQRSLTSQMQVFIRTNRHRTDYAQHEGSIFVNFETPTDSTLEIVAAASAKLQMLFRDGYGYKKAGVVLYGISDNNGVQSSLFDTIDRTKHANLMSAIDRINSEMGRSTIKMATEGDGKLPTTTANQSPNYSTQWDDLLTIKL